MLTAIRELREIGIEISEEYEENVKRSIIDRIQKRKDRKLQENEIYSEWDNEFEFITGYTANGFPYGIKNDETN